MQNYSTIIGVIELRQSGCGYRTIRSRYSIGGSAVELILNRFKEIGIPLNELKTMNPIDVENRFYPPENRRNTNKALPDFFAIHEIMTKMKHPESFFASMKKEYFLRKEYGDISSLRRDIFYYIEMFYNRKRLHSTLGYMSPVSYRLQRCQVQTT